jgi:ectoine hydroxylase-related dioxygenase (phytanoyl-CoA dioxygenase family)
MKEKSYGVRAQADCDNELDLYLEEISNVGFSIIENVLSNVELKNYRKKIDSIYKLQEDQFGLANLKSIKDNNICRMPLKYDDYFIHIATNPIVLEVVTKILGDFYVLGLQNANICHPNEQSHQSLWHRDLPYQNYVISNPISINALFCIDDFSIETGGTIVAPYKKHSVTLNVKAGSVVIFDSMLLHKAGYNSSSELRRSVNHQYQIPLLKQFYDFPKALNGKFSDDHFLAQLLGYSSIVPLDDVMWRNSRKRKEKF